MNEFDASAGSRGVVVALDGNIALGGRDGAVADEPLAARDIKFFADLYRSVVSRRALNLCRSVPLEILLSVITSDQILVPLRSVIDAVNSYDETHSSEEITGRWINIMVSQKIFLTNSNDNGIFISMSPDYLSNFIFEI